MTFALFAGLAAGLLHVFSGPDHLAAVAPLAADTDRSHWRTGLQWGVGHTIGVLLIACLLLLIREQLPLDAMSVYSERLVGVALILVGGWGVWKASRSGFKPHSHAGASFGMGALHGLAGSSHLFGVLPALAFATRFEAALYLTGFGAGAIIGMTAFSAILGLLSSRFSRRHSSGLLYASSAAALVIGGFWLVGQ
ncbi:MAG: High-affinity nickel transporter [Vicinamibacterales bacterium]